MGISLKQIKYNLCKLDDLRGSEKREYIKLFEEFLIKELKNNFNFSVDEIEFKKSQSSIVCKNKMNEYIKMHFYQNICEICMSGKYELRFKLD